MPTSDTACRSLRWCEALLQGLVAGGMQTLVLSPGSRSTPVVIAAERRDGLTLVPILDERSAAFFALGCAKGSGRPVALLATSGSAPSHWYPAVIEAAESGVPLVLLSADRPPRLRGWGASQTIDQTRLFGPFVRESHDQGLPDDSLIGLKAARALGLRAAGRSLAPVPGPIHLNLPFEEPLVPVGDCTSLSLAPLQPPTPLSDVRLDLADWPGGSGLVVCGPGCVDRTLASAIVALVRKKSLPVLADPLSGLRLGSAAGDVLAGYDALLRNPVAAERLRPDWVLRIGGTPVSKRLGEWIAGVPAFLCATAGWSDPSHDAVQCFTTTPGVLLDALSRCPAVEPDPDRLRRWRQADARVGEIAAAHLGDAPWFEGGLVRTLLDRIADGESLHCANSLLIRQMDTWSGTRRQAQGIRLLGNRGASGIDGQTSTLAGLNQGGGPCWGLLGDLSLFHDLGGLLLKDRLERPLLVVNNGGGRIFDYLPQRALPGLESHWRTPVDVDLGALAGTFGLAHRVIGSQRALERVLGEVRAGSGARMLIEVRIDADRSRAIHLDYWRRVAEAQIW